MKFGYVPDDTTLDRIDFHLPADDPGNAAILESGAGAGKVFVGCAEYRVREWNGLLYPERTKEPAMLELYAKQFGMMEMNGTHHRIYPPEQIAKWAATTGDDSFLFLPKFPKFISHESHSFEERQDITAAFIDSVSAFGSQLGPLFLQMSESFSPQQRRDFFAYLASLPEGPTYFVELRHPDWFLDPHVRQELLAACRALGIGLVITDTPGHREVCHMALSIPKVMIRFVGRHRHVSTAARLANWTDRLRAWRDAGLEAAYFVVHTGLSAPLTAAEVIPLFNALPDIAIPEPKLHRDASGISAELF
jgi:uncharacterized protein YecE (DUF72 family)